MAPFAEGIFGLIVLVIGGGVLLIFGGALWLGKGLRGKLVGLCVASAICSPILWPIANAAFENFRESRLKAKVTPICEQELKANPGPFLVDGFLDETEGGLAAGDIEYFLTEGAMRFIEVKLNGSQHLSKPQDGSGWPAEKREGYALMQLGSSNEAPCYVRDKTYPDHFFTSRAPVRPGTCLQVTYSDQPSARYRVKVQIDPSDSDLSRWVLTDSSTNKIVAGYTDAFKAMKYSSFPPWFSRNPSESCLPSGRSGYSTLMQRIQPTEAAVNAASEHLLKKGPLNIEGLPATWAALGTFKESPQMASIPSTDAPYAGDEKSYQRRRSPTWTESYRLAEQHGAWVADNLLIRPKEGLVQEIPYIGLAGTLGTTGSELIFAQGRSGPGDPLAIFGIGFDGKTRWAANLAKLTPWTADAKLDFEPEWFELTRENLLIHGRYGHYASGKSHRKNWTITVPLTQLMSRPDSNFK